MDCCGEERFRLLLQGRILIQVGSGHLRLLHEGGEAANELLFRLRTRNLQGFVHPETGLIVAADILACGVLFHSLDPFGDGDRDGQRAIFCKELLPQLGAQLRVVLQNAGVGRKHAAE